jgi:hypothetical protein
MGPAADHGGTAIMTESLQDWAAEELLGVRLGHAARAACAVDVLANLARGRGSRVTEFAANSAERQRAYGFVENERVDPAALTEAAAQAALRRAAGAGGRCIVAVDGSSLHLADEFGAKGFGRVGGQDSTRGLIVQTALAMSEDGVPIGVLAQEYWARPLEKSPKGRKGERRPVDEKEVKHWLEVIATAEAAGIDGDMDGQLWFQLDRGYDCSAVLDTMAASLNRFTVRGTYNRALWVKEDATDDVSDAAHRYVSDALDAAAVTTMYDLAIEATSEHSERTATLVVQAARVDVRLSDPSRRVHTRDANGKRRKVPQTWPRTLTVVRVREAGTTPADEKPLQWMLWVNFEVATVEDALDVITKYTYRWRVEEFHRTWKSGAMKVETTQTRSGDNVERIARLSAFVACRLLRLARRVRCEPDAPASEEFSQPEILVLTHMDPRSPKQAPRPQRVGTIAWAVAVIADLGGYTGKSSGGPPGPLVIARGFQRLLDRAEGVAAALAILDANRDQW